MGCLCTLFLTHWGLVAPFSDIDLGQHWLRLWLVAWRHQAITWTNVDLSSVRSSGIHLMAVSWEIPQPPFTEVSLKMTYLKLNLNHPGANELIRCYLNMDTDQWSWRWTIIWINFILPLYLCLSVRHAFGFCTFPCKPLIRLISNMVGMIWSLLSTEMVEAVEIILCWRQQSTDPI